MDIMIMGDVRFNGESYFTDLQELYLFMPEDSVSIV